MTGHEIEHLLATVATSLKPASERVMEMAVRQNYIYAVLDLVMPVVLWVAYAAIHRRWQQSINDADRHFDADTSRIGRAILLAFLTLYTLISISYGCARLLNPYFYALYELVGMAGKLR